MRILVLGAAAGGGFPQWNCNCRNCRRARSGDPAARPRTQSSLAVSADGERWVLLNASPDLRQQVLANPALHPRSGNRDSPIAAVVVTNADVDHVAGLLSLRERQPFALYAGARLHDVLARSLIFGVLDDIVVRRHDLALDRATELMAADRSKLGITVTPFAVPGKVALYLENEEAGVDFGTLAGDTLGLEVASGGKRFFYIPACAAMPPALAERLRGAALVFFDGTLWRDDEMLAAGVGTKTGQRMGHMSLSGNGGTLDAFESLGVTRKVLVHLNNTNPVLLADSMERHAVVTAGWEVAEDGMEIEL